MDEQVVYERFHEALDLGSRPGGYDRMRHALINYLPAAKSRPARRMRFTKMTFRFVASLVAAAIVIAVAVALVASHHTTTGLVNADQQNNLRAYQVLIRSDYNRMEASTSDNCNTIDDRQCSVAVSRVVTALDQWIADLNGFQTPSQFAALDLQLRRHLSDAAADLNAAVAFQRANDPAGFNLAMEAALYERGWIDPASFVLDGSYQKFAPTYQAAVSAAKAGLDNCVNGTPTPADFGCSHLMSSASCPSATAVQCESDVETAETQLQQFMISLAQNPAPASAAANATKLQNDLARADAALLAIRDALLKNDLSKMTQARSDFTAAIGDAHDDPVNI